MKINVSRLANFNTSKILCIAYDNQKICDGAGAQLQRIAEIYGLSKLYNFQFSKEKIKTIDSNPGDGIKTVAEKNLVVEEINQLFINALGTCDHDSHTDFEPRFMLLAKKFKLIWIWIGLNKIFSSRKFNPRMLLSDLSFTRNLDPLLYGFFREKIIANSQFKAWVRMDSVPQIQVHFLGAKNSEALLSDRYINYNKLLPLLSLLKDRYPTYKSLLHTDLDPSRERWKIVGTLDKKTEDYWINSGFLGENYSIRENKLDPRHLFPVEVIDDVLSNVSPIEVWRHMANAEVLICGKSSLSFIGGLINIKSKAKIIAPKSFINYPTDWIMLDFDQENPIEGIQF